MPDPLIGDDETQANSSGASPASDADPSSAASEETVTPSDDATDTDEEPSTLDAINAALGDAEKEDADETAGEADQQGDKDEKQPDKDAKKDAEPTEISDEEMQSYAPKTQKRIQQLLDERKAEFEAHNVTKAEIERLKPAADRYEAIEKFRVESELTTDEMATGFEIMRMIRQDPTQALKALLPYVEALQQVTGEALPEDLKRDVDAGAISEERAQELSRARSAARLQQEAAAKANERAATVDRKTQDADRARQERSAIDAWDAMQTQNDPDYVHIRPFLTSEIQALMAQKRPLNDIELTSLLNQAKANVEGRLKQANFRRVDPKPPVDPVRPTSTPGAPANEKPPQDTLDIINRSLAASGQTR